MRCLRLWFHVRLSTAGLMVGLCNVGGLLQSEWFYDSIMFLVEMLSASRGIFLCTTAVVICKALFFWFEEEGILILHLVQWWRRPQRESEAHNRSRLWGSDRESQIHHIINIQLPTRWLQWQLAGLLTLPGIVQLFCFAKYLLFSPYADSRDLRIFGNQTKLKFTISCS